MRHEPINCMGVLTVKQSEDDAYKELLASVLNIILDSYSSWLETEQKFPEQQSAICEMSFNDHADMKKHIQPKHTSSLSESGTDKIQEVSSHDESCAETPLECDVYQYKTELALDLKKHRLSHSNPNKCQHCEYESNSLFALNLHIQTDHEVNGETGHVTPTAKHQAKQYNEIKKCDKCEFTASTKFAFAMHIQSQHADPPPAISFPCPTCGMIFSEIRDLNVHVQRRHGRLTKETDEPSRSKLQSDMKHYMKYIIEQNQEMMEEFYEFKTTMVRRFDELAENQVKLCDDIENIKEDSKTKEKENQSILIKGFDTLVSGMKVLESNQVHLSQQICDVAIDNTLTSKSSPQEATADQQTHSEPGTQQKKKEKVKTCDQCDFIVHNEMHKRKHLRVAHGVKAKMLWVGDSINCNVDFSDMSEKMNMIIKSAKAYTATGDSKDAKFPEKNFLDVVEKELKEQSYDYLVLGGGTVEITNLNTSVTPEEDIARFKDETIESSKKLFSLAESALHKCPLLDKVVILRRPPRFDPVSVDPLELKPQLSRLGDAILFDLWCNSSFKKNIAIGDHQVPHRIDDDHYKVYGHPSQSFYDGIHMRGPAGRQVFQDSVLNIMKSTGLYKEQNDIKLPKGRKPGSGTSNLNAWKLGKPSGTIGNNKKPPPPERRHPHTQYDPMERMISRIRSVSTNRRTQSPPESDDVFFLPNGTTYNAQETQRPTVIKAASLQEQYNVPVSNKFSNLLN